MSELKVELIVPVYPEGDPKMGEPLKQGDDVHWWTINHTAPDPCFHKCSGSIDYLAYDTRESSTRFIPVLTEHAYLNNVMNEWPIFSCPKARDAALKKAKRALEKRRKEVAIEVAKAGVRHV